MVDGSYDFQVVCVPNGTADGWWDIISGGGWATYALTVDSGTCWNGDSTYANYTFTVDGADSTVAHCAGSCDTTCPAPQTGSSVFMTEITDPQNSSTAGRYVELYNNGDSSVDLSGWALQRWTNGNTDPQTAVPLTGTVSCLLYTSPSPRD